MVDLKTSIGKLIFTFPLMNASGILGSTEAEIKRVLESESAAAVIKTVTLEKRLGNSGVRFYWEEEGSLNSMGFPNQGIDYYCSIIEKLNKYGKPVILSIAGFSEEEFIKIITIADKRPFSGIEINISCPNIEGKGIFAYDFKTSTRIIKKMRKISKKTLGVKMPPFSQRTEIQEYSKLITAEGIDFITTMNTFPLSCFVDWKKEVMRIKPNMGIGGFGGRAVKQIALAQVVLFRYYTQGKIPIIGVGGISKAEDVYQFILAGASAVQIGTELLRNGPKIFHKLKIDVIKILEEKRVKKLSDKIGKLKYL